jgi:hypothetical protein
MNTLWTSHSRSLSRNLFATLHRPELSLRTDRRIGVGPSVLAAGCLMAICACQGNSARSMADRVCEQAGDDSVLAAALTGFVDRANPEPGFLAYVPATDSTPPAAAVQQMENRRTTYMYSTDPKLQAQVDNQIKSYGDYDALLVAYHGMTKTDPLHPVVTFSGHYIVGSKVVGQTVGPFQIKPVCDTTGSWTVPAAPNAPQAATTNPSTPAASTTQGTPVAPAAAKSTHTKRAG